MSTSRRYLTAPGLEFIVLDYDDRAAMKQAIESHEGWDYIIYNLGATKCANYLDFKRINFEYLRTFTEVLKETGLALWPSGCST